MTGAKPVCSKMRPDFSHRSQEAEWLDSPDIDPGELEAALRDLARFNGAMFGHAPVFRWLRGAIGNAPRENPLSVLDVGCGYGDLLRAIRRWSRKRGVPLALHGIDLNPETIRIARAVTPPEDDIAYHAADAFAYPPDASVDLIVSSLLAHHLMDIVVVGFLRWMEATARRGWLICDLQRHLVPYYFIGLAGTLARLHPMVIHDGQISVARSLTRSEWRERLADAGIPREAVTIRWFLFRHAIGRMR